MPAVHDSRIGKRQELVLNAPQQRWSIAAGKVGPTDRAIEKHIPAQDHTVTHESHMARRMAGDMPNAKGEIPHLEYVTLVKFLMPCKSLLKHNAVS